MAISPYSVPIGILLSHNARKMKAVGRPAVITKHIRWHVFQHTFSTLLPENDEDVKTVQSLMRHANGTIPMNIYTHGVSCKKAGRRVTW